MPDSRADLPSPPRTAGRLLHARLLLEGLYPHPEEAPQTSIADGWDLIGPVRALVFGDTWVRSARGMWLVECNFEIRSADGRRTLPVRGQLVPGHLLRVLDA